VIIGPIIVYLNDEVFMDLEVSVVIPCKNEKETIAEVIIAVARALQQGGFRYEIIVVDNGSTDGSDKIAKNINVNVIYSSARTVAGVRNMGVYVARGKLLVFLDADVVVQGFWGQTLRVVYEDMMKFDNMITGSQCTVPGNIKPLLASWYIAISSDTRDTHLGTGHMIVSADTFNRVGGFNEELVTGEDYDFCFRAKTLGINVVSNQQMVACHYGYPPKLAEFCRREVWHGEGDCANFKTIINSNVALCGMVIVLLNIIMLLSLIVRIQIFLLCLTTVLIISFSVSIYKFGFDGFKNLYYRSIISYIYLFCRGLSLPSSIIKKLKIILKQLI